MSPLDTDEQSILASVEADEWQSIVGLPREIKRYQRYAQSQAVLDDRPRSNSSRFSPTLSLAFNIKIPGM